VSPPKYQTTFDRTRLNPPAAFSSFIIATGAKPSPFSLQTITASAHRGKWGQVTPCGKMDEKLKSENVQKELFSCLCYILTAIKAADVENGAMLTTYLFAYTSECTIS